MFVPAWQIWWYNWNLVTVMALYFVWFPTILVFQNDNGNKFLHCVLDYYGWQIQLEIVTELNLQTFDNIQYNSYRVNNKAFQ